MIASGPARGRCLCGAVAFEVDGPMKQIIGCHCTMCRRQTSHFLAFTTAWDADLSVTGEESLSWYRSGADSQRGFCRKCGSMLFFATDGADRTSISAGALDPGHGLKLAAHIFTDAAGEYYTPDDDVPCFRGGGDDVPMPPRR